MDEPSVTVPDDALAAISHLSRSENRVRILDALAAASHTRGVLAAETGVARTTVDRIVTEFEARGWAERTVEGEYAATPAGVRIAREFTDFVDTVASIERLGDMVAWLPTDEVPIELAAFSDATIRRPNPTDPMANSTYLTELLRESAEFSCLVGVAPPLAFEEAMRDGVTERDLTTNHVVTDAEYRYLCTHPERCARWREYLAAGANVYRYDGDVPCNLLVFDGTVIVGNSQSGIGDPRALVESDREEVRSWVHRVIDRYRRDAERLDATHFE